MRRMVFAAALALAASCRGEKTLTDTTRGVDLPFTGNATVRCLGIEGGCWALSVNNENYEPTNLPPEFKVNGMSVYVRFNTKPGAASICMIGPIVTIETIRKT